MTDNFTGEARAVQEEPANDAAMAASKDLESTLR